MEALLDEIELEETLINISVIETEANKLEQAHISWIEAIQASIEASDKKKAAFDKYAVMEQEEKKAAMKEIAALEALRCFQRQQEEDRKYEERLQAEAEFSPLDLIPIDDEAFGHL